MAVKWYNPSTWFSGKEMKAVTPESKLAAYRLSNYRNFATVSFNGQKTPGNAGPVIDYQLDHQSLIVSGWQAMIESTPAKIAVSRRVRWLIGKGLKLQSEPVMDILKDEGITLDKDKFTRAVEARWNLFARSKSADYSGRKNLNQLSAVMEKNGEVAGDVLVVLRVIKGRLKVQLIDAAHVRSPEYGTASWPQELPNGHLIIDGIEVNEQREHVAFWVRTYALSARMENIYEYKYERVAARGEKSGMLMAYMYNGDDFRIDTQRGMSRLATFVEKLTNMDLYSAAALKQAQEAAKIDYQAVHDKDAVGDAPWAKAAAEAANGYGPEDNDDNPKTDDGVQKRTTINVTGIGTAINNPKGSKIEMLKNENPQYFKDFNDTHRDEVFAGMEIPPDVAMSKYGQSYSASRAATKDWEHTLVVGREYHVVDGLKPIYDLWLDVEILSNRIQAPGYIMARQQRNDIVLEAYRNMRMVGPNVPHIDPVKEVTAARLKLGEAGAFMPLADPERITESLGEGDWNENKEQFAKDKKWCDDNDLKAEPVLQQVTGGANKPAKKKPKPD
jgi:capsid protein